jgi:O-antigen/teichoic acid export membrane protein
VISIWRNSHHPSSNLSGSTLGEIASGSALAFGGAGISTALTYLQGIVIGRFLGPETLGLYFLAFGAMQVLSAVCRVGMAEGLTRFIPALAMRGDLPALRGSLIFGVTLVAGVSSLAAVVVLLAAEPLAVAWFRQPLLADYLRWAALCLPALTISLVTINAIQALRRTDFVVLSRDLLQPGLMLVLGLVFLLLGSGVTGVLAGYFASVVASMAAAFYLLRYGFPTIFRPGTITVHWMPMLAFSLPLGAGDLAYYSFRWVDTFVLSIYRSASEVGIYNAALRTTLILNLLPIALSSLYGPTVAELQQSGRTGELQALLRTVLRWGLTLAVPMLAGMCLLATDVMAAWGPEFVAGAQVLMVLAGAQFLAVASGVLGPTILLSGRQYLETANVAGVVVISVLANLALVPGYGAMGAAIALVLAQACALAVRIVQVQFVLRLDLVTSQYLKPALAIAPVSAIVILLKLWADAVPYQPGVSFMRLGVLGLVLGAGYVLTLVWFGMEREDLLIWHEFKKKLGWAGV